MRRPWTIAARAGGEIEILIFEEIGEDFYGEGITSKQFAEDLKAIGSVSKIHLRVNSPGGNVFDGIAIYNTLLSHGAKVTAQVDGIAASIAGVIIMAASEISMAENSILMLHNPWAGTVADAAGHRKMSETLDKVKTSMVTSYRRHTSLSVAKIGAIMDAETWFSAAEAVDAGFAETIMAPGERADMAANLDPRILRYKHVPAAIAARLKWNLEPDPVLDRERLRLRSELLRRLP